MIAQHATGPRRGNVVVVGSANVDLVVDVPRHPGGGETILGGDLRRSPGGKGANQAVAAARAGGADTSFVGALGHDESGELLLASLDGAGVRTDLVERVEAPTGTALITVSPDGENAIVVAPGANSHVRIGAAQAERLGAADVVLAQLEIPLDVVLAAAAVRRPARPSRSTRRRRATCPTRCGPCSTCWSSTSTRPSTWPVRPRRTTPSSASPRSSSSACPRSS